MLNLPAAISLVHILVAGVKAAGVAAHGHQATAFGQRHHSVRAFDAVSQRNFNLHMLARLQTSHGLVGMHLGWCAKNDGIDFFQSQAFCQIGCDVCNTVFGRHFFGFFNIAADERDDFNTIDIFNAVQVFDAECASACQGYFYGFGHVNCSPESGGQRPCWMRAHGRSDA